MRTLEQSFLFALIASISLGVLADSSGQPVRVRDVEILPIHRVVSTYGVLAPKIEDLSFRINGRIANFNTVEGATVESGQVLAELEKEMLKIV